MGACNGPQKICSGTEIQKAAGIAAARIAGAAVFDIPGRDSRGASYPDRRSASNAQAKAGI